LLMNRFDFIHLIPLKSVGDVLAHVRADLIRRDRRLGFRGSCDASSPLEPTLSRYVRWLEKIYGAGERNNKDITNHVLTRLHSTFKSNLINSGELSQERAEQIDLWQYGRHFGLPSPLLDWTWSPYMALFFALVSSPTQSQPLAGERCLWVLDVQMIDHLNSQVSGHIWPKRQSSLQPEGLLKQQFPKMEIVLAACPENRRATAQQGFFTKHVYYSSLEVWLKRITDELDHDQTDRRVLTKIVFPCGERERMKALDELDCMGISHRTLFPDVFGSVQDALLSAARSLQTPRTSSYSLEHSAAADRDSLPLA